MNQQMVLLIFLIVIMFVVPYFTVTKPQKKQQQLRKQMLESLKKGDEIMTIGGFFGTIRSIKDDRVVIELAPDKILAQIKIDAVSDKVSQDVEEVTEDEDDEYEIVLPDDDKKGTK